MQRIALCGEMGSGKTTLANILRDNHNYFTMSFGFPVKVIAAELYSSVYYYQNRLNPTKVDPLDIKDQPHARELLQMIGHDIGRAIDENMWVTLLSETLEMFPADARIVIDDVRYPNELSWCRDNGFTIVGLRPEFTRIMSERTDRQRQHPSEGALLAYAPDLLIRNNSREQLKEFAKLIADEPKQYVEAAMNVLRASGHYPLGRPHDFI